MTNIKKYIDQAYPKNERENLATLDISNQGLTGTLTLEIKEFPVLEVLDCSNNQITGIVFAEPSKTRLGKKQKLEWKLKSLKLDNNGFAQDLSFLEELTELEELSIANNKFSGSLELLKSMPKLKKLDISDTDIEQGLEYLSTSLKEIHCCSKIRKDAKVKSIEEVIIPLFKAVKENKIEEIGEIVRAKNLKNLNFYDGQGNTLLHYATQKDNLPLLKLLVRNGSNVNATDIHGWTALHKAALWIVNNQGDWNIIEFLLENDADTYVETESGLTARDIFFRKDYSYIEQYDNLVEKVFQQTQILVKK